MPQLATIAAFGFPDFNPPTLLPMYRQIGCTSCQFYRNTKNAPTPTDARRIAEDAGLPIDSIHGVFGPDYDPSSPDEAVRRRSVDAYEAEAELALQLGGPHIVVHPAAPAGDESVTDASRSRRAAPLRRSLEELSRMAERHGVTYLIENIPPNYHLGCDAPQLATMIRDLNHPRVRMCFDTGHAHMFGHVPTLLQNCRDVIAYFHVHDNDAATDSHMVPGRATLPWDELAPIMGTMSPTVPAMLELFESEAKLRQEMENGLAEKLRRWMALGE